MTGETVLIGFLRLVIRPLPGGLVLPRPHLASFPDSEEALVFVNPLSSGRAFPVCGALSEHTDVAVPTPP